MRCGGTVQSPNLGSASACVAAGNHIAGGRVVTSMGTIRKMPDTKAALFSAAAIGSLAAGAAAAGDRYTAAIDVNIRSGPGADYPIVEVLPAGDAIRTMKCEAGWCSVATFSGAGFIAARFLSREGAAPENRAAANSGGPAVAPRAALDATTTASVPAVDPPTYLELPDSALKYVATHRPISVDLGYEARVGEAIPAEIRLRDIPGSRYQYVYVDDRPVFVDGQSRRIVKVEP